MTHGVDTFAPGNLELANCITREETFNFYINYFKTSTVSLKLSCEVCIFSCFVLVGFRSNGPFLWRRKPRKVYGLWKMTKRVTRKQGSVLTNAVWVYDYEWMYSAITGLHAILSSITNHWGLLSRTYLLSGGLGCLQSWLRYKRLEYTSAAWSATVCLQTAH